VWFVTNNRIGSFCLRRLRLERLLLDEDQFRQARDLPLDKTGCVLAICSPTLHSGARFENPFDVFAAVLVGRFQIVQLLFEIAGIRLQLCCLPGQALLDR
jgi:hypothetical protein